MLRVQKIFTTLPFRLQDGPFDLAIDHNVPTNKGLCINFDTLKRTDRSPVRRSDNPAMIRLSKSVSVLSLVDSVCPGLWFLNAADPPGLIGDGRDPWGIGGDVLAARDLDSPDSSRDLVCEIALDNRGVISCNSALF